MSAMTSLTALLLLLSAVLAAQPPADRDIVAKIRAEAMAHSQVAPIFDYLTVAIGPRLTASPAHKRAAEWTRDRLAAYGLSNAHLEPWTFGRGWALEKLTIEMGEPRYPPPVGHAGGRAAATRGRIAAAPLFPHPRT